MYFPTSSSNESWPRCARSMILMAVNWLDVEAALKMDAAVMGTPTSRFAIPYPRSYTRAPFLLMATLQPGESDLFHFANNSSTLALPDRAGDGLPVRGLPPCEDSFGAMKERITTAVMIKKQAGLAIIFTSRFTQHRRFPAYRSASANSNTAEHALG